MRIAPDQVTKPVGWGVIGASSYVATRAVLPAIAAGSACVLAAVASATEGAAWELGVRFGATSAYDRYQDVLDDPAVECVYIPLPNGLHREWTLRAAAAGKHVLCEKPLAPDAAAAQAMADACRQAGVILMEAYMSPFHPRAVALDDLVAGDRLGEFRSGWATFTFRLRDPGNHRWRPEMGGGALLDLGVYCVEPLLGAARAMPTAVSARAVMAPSGVDSTFCGWLDFGSRCSAAFSVSFEGPERQQLELLGTVAAVSVTDGFAGGAAGTRVLVRHDDGRTNGIDRADADPYQAMVEHFAAVVRGQATLERGPERSIAVLEVLDRLRVAAAMPVATQSAPETILAGDPGASR